MQLCGVELLQPRNGPHRWHHAPASHALEYRGVGPMRRAGERWHVLCSYLQPVSLSFLGPCARHLYFNKEDFIRPMSLQRISKLEIWFQIKADARSPNERPAPIWG
jgi:hypothetical protein